MAATWYPVNDHPLDKASYSFRVTVPAGLQAVANGELRGVATKRGWSTWRWEAREPMASYLATASVGEWDLDAYRADGIRYWDALDPDLFDVHNPAPASLRHLAGGGHDVQEAVPYLRCAGGRRRAVVLGHPRHRTELGLLLRRGPRRRLRRVDDAARPRGKHQRRHRVRLSLLARPASVPDPLPDRQRGRHLQPERHLGGPVVGRQRRQRGYEHWRWTSPPTPASGSRCP